VFNALLEEIKENVMEQDILVSFALMIGSDLVRETDLPSPLAPLGTETGIDGALILSIHGNERINERYWDRLDTLFLHLLDALEEVRQGRTSIAHFPDTRLELKLSPHGDIIRLELEYVEFDAPLEPLYQAVTQCAQRLVNLGDGLAKTEALLTLKSRLEDSN
jgi:hypothetical protein